MSVDDHERPSYITMDGRPYERFMDFIYVPSPLEELKPRQLVVINALRRGLLDSGRATLADTEVKERLGVIGARGGWGSVLDWGCGYQSLQPYLARAEWTGVDLDPQVVQHHRIRGHECWLREEAATALRGRQFDAVIAVFVLHFEVSETDVETMVRSVRDDGLIIANVYRRTEASRIGLLTAFARAGAEVARAEDATHLCRDHEFWVASPKLPYPYLQGVARTLALARR